MSAHPSMTHSPHVRVGKMTWGDATRTFIVNGGNEKKGLRKFLIALRTIGVYGAPVALLDDTTFWMPGVNLFTVGNDILLWALIPAGFYSIFRINTIRRRGGL